MKRRLPPFPAVRAFEAAARHLSMQGAADELLLSPSAISHQVKALESFVGTALFERARGRLKLTQTGSEYLVDLRAALELIEAASARASRQGESNHITVHMYHSLAELWLVPHLKEFRERHPDMTISVVSEETAADFSSGIADVAISYAHVEAGRERDFLFFDELSPCCSLDYEREHGPIRTPGDLLDHSLILCNSDPKEWAHWFDAAGLPAREPKRWVEFDLRAGAVQAACEGLGVAMGRRPYCDVAINRGKLVQPLKGTAATGYGYLLTAPARTRHLAKVKTFSAWVREICRGVGETAQHHHVAAV